MLFIPPFLMFQELTDNFASKKFIIILKTLPTFVTSINPFYAENSSVPTKMPEYRLLLVSAGSPDFHACMIHLWPAGTPEPSPTCFVEAHGLPCAFWKWHSRVIFFRCGWWLVSALKRALGTCFPEISFPFLKIFHFLY